MSARVSVTVMAHPDRERFIPELLRRLDRPAEVIWDRYGDRWDTGRRAMLAYDREATHHLVIQDDALVCNDLVAGVERALEHVPAKAGVPTPLCLYAGRIRPFRTYVERLVDRARESTSWLTMAQLHWGVGIVLPTSLIEDCIAWGDGRSDIANYDKRISRYLDSQRITVWYPWPSLVDHRTSPSLVPGRTSRGRYAHRFLGADQSALDVDWTGRVVSVPQLNQHLSHNRRKSRRPLRT